MNLLKIIDELKKISNNTENDDEAKTLIKAYLRESKRKLNNENK